MRGAGPGRDGGPKSAFHVARPSSAASAGTVSVPGPGAGKLPAQGVNGPAGRVEIARNVMDCGGKRSATPLSCGRWWSNLDIS
jgi:hypothetical protein